MAVTLASVLVETSSVLAKAGKDDPRRRARQLVSGALGLTAADLLRMSDLVLECSEVNRLYALIRRLAGGEPLSRVLGRREFWGLDFELSPDTLDPRPDSEVIIEAVLARVDRSAPHEVLDLGTGSGCLLLSLLSELPAGWGLGVDVLEGAVATARRNAQLLGFADRSRFVVGDWGTAIGHRFDIIVTNPPYIARSGICKLPYEVKGYDPQRALDGGEDGLTAYRSIASQLPSLLKPFAMFATEVAMGHAAAVGAILAERGLTLESVARDLSGIERCVTARGVHG